MNREIPGFYYDPEKKKYFKIEASHKAPAGSQYSKDAVKRKRKDQEVCTTRTDPILSSSLLKLRRNVNGKSTSLGG